MEQINNVEGNTPTTIGEIYKWNQMSGQKASSSGTIYGIYDLAGGQAERIASYVASGTSNLTEYAKSLLYQGDPQKEKNTKYTTVYTIDVNDDKAGVNYKLETNKRRFGNAIFETSTEGTGNTSWYNDESYFIGNGKLLIRGGSIYIDEDIGLFYFCSVNGGSTYNRGFRVALVCD